MIFMIHTSTKEVLGTAHKFTDWLKKLDKHIEKTDWLILTFVLLLFFE